MLGRILIPVPNPQSLVQRGGNKQPLRVWQFFMGGTPYSPTGILRQALASPFGRRPDCLTISNQRNIYAVFLLTFTTLLYERLRQGEAGA
ncbi:hypothetical protein [Nostoc sp.]|uniref:hypothetical protein n=1 Tax=Nostoc sp. TaxID=1180 RepID=UPI002FF9CF68